MIRLIYREKRCVKIIETYEYVMESSRKFQSNVHIDITPSKSRLSFSHKTIESWFSRINFVILHIIPSLLQKSFILLLKKIKENILLSEKYYSLKLFIKVY